MRLPHGVLGGTRRRQLFSNIDVLPTVLGYLGIASPKGIDGEAVDLRAPESPGGNRIRFGQATKPWEEVETDPRWFNIRKSRCIRQGGLKFIQNPWRGNEEFYDLASDPGETNNLLEHPSSRTVALAAGLRSKLEAWAASARPLPSQFESSQREETLKRLKSLGYVK
jgi:arylsulfatase A-like enzyme